jgi:succinyl-CoA synthetase beta subunit
MRLLEHEAKALLHANMVPIPEGMIITKHDTRSSIHLPTVLKSQVPVGGRGKLGGVVIVESKEELESALDTLFSLDIKGYTPNVLLAEEKVSILREHYVSLLIDRDSASIRLIAYKDGGVEVENNISSHDFLNIAIDESTIDSDAKQLASYLEYDIKLVHPLLTRLYATFTHNDATLLEINPLIYTTEGALICGDCKMELDDAARFRHSEWNFEDEPSDTNFVSLDPDGSIATIANGAGLAMATVDAVAARKMKPANFLDIGGGANTASVLTAFKRIMEFKRIDAIVINIFAGITRCDEVARAIIEAKKQIDSLPPLFIRLAGTNFEEAVALLAAEDITTMASLDECLAAAKEVTRE